MKRIICIVLSVLIILALPVLGVCETQTRFLKTPLSETEATPETFCANDEIRALVIVGLQLSLMQQEKISDGHFDSDVTFIGYKEASVFVVSALSETQRVIFEFDTEYHTCKYRIEDNADMSQNEMICKELCQENYWVANQKAIESSLYGLMK